MLILTSSLRMILTLSWFLTTMHLCSHRFNLKRTKLLLKNSSPLMIKRSKNLQAKTKRKTRRTERKTKTRRARKGHVVAVIKEMAVAKTRTWSIKSSSKEAMSNSANLEASRTYEMACIFLILVQFETETQFILNTHT